MSNDGDGAERLRELKKEIDITNRRRAEAGEAELRWQVAQIERRRGNIAEFIDEALAAQTGLFNTNRRYDGTAILLSLWTLPRDSFSEDQRLALALANFVYQSSHSFNDGSISEARQEVCRLIEQIQHNRPEIAGYLNGYVKWFSMDPKAFDEFANAASIARKGSLADKYIYSQESLYAVGLMVAFDVGRLSSTEVILDRLDKNRDALSSYDVDTLLEAKARLRYFKTPRLRTRKDLLAQIANKSNKTKQLLKVEIEFLTSILPWRGREAQFRLSLSAIVRGGYGCFGRYQHRRLVAAFGVNRLRLARGQYPKTFRPELREALKGPHETITSLEYARWRAFADRAVRALERWAMRMDCRHACNNFSADARHLRTGLNRL